MPVTRDNGRAKRSGLQIVYLLKNTRHHVKASGAHANLIFMTRHGVDIGNDLVYGMILSVSPCFMYDHRFCFLCFLH